MKPYMWKIFGLLLILLVAGLTTWPFTTSQPSEQRSVNGSGIANDPAGGMDFMVSDPVFPTISPALRDLPLATDDQMLDREVNPRHNPQLLQGDTPENIQNVVDPLVGLDKFDAGRTPLPTLNFDGLINTSGVTPPDTIGDVGPNHYVQAVNSTRLIIYDKSGNVLVGPIQMNDLWPSGGCASSNSGDPVVVYDGLADRWVIAQFRSGFANGYCVAVSQTPDATGVYYGYEFATPQFPDYFKIGVWPDAYYVGSNENAYSAYALDRNRMLQGLSATFQRFTNQTNFLLPADVDGPTAPPAGAPGYFYTYKDNTFHGGIDRLEIFAFHVDWVTPANSTFSIMDTLPVTAYTYTVCGFFVLNCIDQPSTNQDVDPVSEWPMWRLAYRNFGDHETMVANFTVDVGADQAGIRWYELRKSGPNWSIYQEGTHSLDANHRWMGSIVMDGDGNMALGYNVSNNSDVFPSIRYVTRLATDPLNTWDVEQTLVAGGGSQTGSNRWGDYSAMSVDPADDCTFWFTGEYYSTNGSTSWRTRIGTFKIPTCGQGGGTPTPTPLTATATPTNTPEPPTSTPTATPSAGQYCSSPNLAIPDVGSASDTMSVSDSGTLTDLNVYLQVTHTWVGDLTFTITHNGLTSVVIIDRPGVPVTTFGCSGDNIDATLDDEAALPVENECAAGVPTINGTFIPNNLLSAFDGGDLAGNWMITADDSSAGDVGTLVQWCLVPTVQAGPTATPTNTPQSATSTPTATTAAPTATATPPGNDIYIWLPVVIDNQN